MEWRNTWEMGDLTAYMAWGSVKEFFKFCVRNNWIVKSLAEFIKRPGIEKGNRTAIFTNKQYETILKRAKAKNEKLTALVLLLRWSAMSSHTKENVSGAEGAMVEGQEKRIGRAK